VSPAQIKNLYILWPSDLSDLKDLLSYRIHLSWVSLARRRRVATISQSVR